MMCLGKQICYVHRGVDGVPQGEVWCHSWGEMMRFLGKRWWSFPWSGEGGIPQGLIEKVDEVGEDMWSRKPIQWGKSGAREEGWKGGSKKKLGLGIVNKLWGTLGKNWIMVVLAMILSRVKFYIAARFLSTILYAISCTWVVKTDYEGSLLDQQSE
jgi:hypothetical protein